MLSCLIVVLCWTHFKLSTWGNVVMFLGYTDFLFFMLFSPSFFSLFLILLLTQVCYYVPEPSWIIMKDYWILPISWRLHVLRQWSRERWPKILPFWFTGLSKWIPCLLSFEYFSIANFFWTFVFKILVNFSIVSYFEAIPLFKILLSDEIFGSWNKDCDYNLPFNFVGKL